jgi:hypothetical protein
MSRKENMTRFFSKIEIKRKESNAKKNEIQDLEEKGF